MLLSAGYHCFSFFYHFMMIAYPDTYLSCAKLNGLLRKSYKDFFIWVRAYRHVTNNTSPKADLQGTSISSYFSFDITVLLLDDIF